MKFSDLGLSDDVLRAVADSGYTTPTPIQEQAIPIVLMGRDVLASAQTGTGKTASFTLPMIEILAAGHAKARMPRSLILEPTRELAAQVAESFEAYGKYCRLSKALLIGGESMAEQTRVIDRGVDVLIATPGRLLDMFERGRLLMTDVKILVIDEADRMLDMGFIPDVEKISSLVSKLRQTLFFSATMPAEIRRLADAFLSNPKRIIVSPPATPAATVRQSLVMVHLPRDSKPGGQKEKRAALREILTAEDVKNALVFCNRKRDIGVIHRSLNRHGYNAGQLHGDMPQSSRTETLSQFKKGEIRLLVCSDVAARGIDIQDMSHVFNFDVPSHAEDYVHRIGRTGRAGRKGRAVTIATSEDRKYLASIAKLIGGPIPEEKIGALAKPAATPAPESKTETEAAAETESPVMPAAGIETAAETEEPKVKSRRPRRRRGDAKPSDQVQNSEKAAAATEELKSEAPEKTTSKPRGKAKDSTPETETKTRAAQAESPARSRKRGSGQKESGERVRGMGDHVPAFMMRSMFSEKKAK